MTDSHLGISKSSDLYHDVVFNLFSEINDVCLDKNISEIIHLGDFFHDRKVLNTKTQNYAHKIAELFKSTATIWLILGNHDVYYKDRLQPTTAELFNGYPHIRVIDKIQKHNNIVLCPWGMIPQGYDGFCMGHFELTGFKMNSSFVCERGQDPANLKKDNNFDHIYSGHFHTPSTQNNITYLGSPYQQTFHDVNSPRGYYIWDNGDMEFIEFKSAPKFMVMQAENVNTKEVKNNIIRLIFNEDHGSVKNQKIIDEIMSFGPIKLQIDFSNVKIQGSEDIREDQVDASLLDHNEIITEYINKTPLPEFVNKKTLETMINKLREE